jgi:Holliday junction resolvase RusA-like endonuclease
MVAEHLHREMTDTIYFEVPGPAAGLARPRVTRHGGHTYVPDPGNFKERVTEYGLAAGLRPKEGAVGLEVHVYRKMPKSWSQKKRDEHDGESCLTRPDLNNVVGACCDALQSVAYDNDSQVVDIEAGKQWAEDDKTQIRVTYFD